MNSKGKYIGINQRIPFDVLDSAINFYMMNGVIAKNDIFQNILEYNSGANRANKATMYLLQIIHRQVAILNNLKRALKEFPYSSLKTDDRKAISLCLISLTYPITYDLLIALAQGFKVQNQINKKFISGKVMSIYGSNRTVDIAIDALLPMVIELNTIKRDKISLYSQAPKLIIHHGFVYELMIYTDIKLSGSKSILIDDVVFKPWYSYFDFSNHKQEVQYKLVSVKDSAIGKGYFTISS
jgi:hypothetical protein